MENSKTIERGSVRKRVVTLPMGFPKTYVSLIKLIKKSLELIKTLHRPSHFFFFIAFFTKMQKGNDHRCPLPLKTMVYVLS